MHSQEYSALNGVMCATFMCDCVILRTWLGHCASVKLLSDNRSCIEAEGCSQNVTTWGPKPFGHCSFGVHIETCVPTSCCC